MDLEKESFELQFVARELNAVSAQQNSALHARLIAEAKKVRELPGALYLATEAMPFDVLSGNFKRTPYNNQSKAFAQTAITPYFRPIIYSHDDGSGGMFQSGSRPDIAGRILSSLINDNGRGGKSIFTGQAITDKDAIERVNSFIDYSQSISFYPSGYTCDVCGADPMKGCGMDESAGRCYNLGKEVSDVDNKKKKVRVTWSVIPNYIAEISFVATPAYQDAMVLGVEQNGLAGSLIGAGARSALQGFFHYVKREGFVAVGDIPEKPLEQNQLQKPPADQNSGTMGSQSKEEQYEMELKEQFEALKKELNEALQTIEANVTALTKKVEASLKPLGEQEKPADTSGSGAPTQPVIPEAIQKVLNEISENTKKSTEQYAALAEKVEQFTKSNQPPAKTEAELAAEKSAAEKAAADEKAAEEKKAEEAAAEAARQAEIEKNRKNQQLAKPKMGKLAKSIVSR